MASRWLRILLGVMAGCGPVLAQASAPVVVSSPDGLIRMTFSTPGGSLVYEVGYRGKAVLDRSALGLEIQNQPVLGTGVDIVSSKSGTVDETYSLLAGKSKEVRNQCNTVTLELSETKEPKRRFTVEARVYNDGAAFRYLLPDAGEVRIANERTQFVRSEERRVGKECRS